jgi:hypothetical protein
MDEWRDFEYYGDLEKFYGRGSVFSRRGVPWSKGSDVFDRFRYGQDLGPVQGVGYTNELLARLTNTPVVDSTQTNRTLDENPETFPLGKTFYADFTHENVSYIAQLAALALTPIL